MITNEEIALAVHICSKHEEDQQFALELLMDCVSSFKCPALAITKLYNYEGTINNDMRIMLHNVIIKAFKGIVKCEVADWGKCKLHKWVVKDNIDNCSVNHKEYELYDQLANSLCKSNEYTCEIVKRGRITAHVIVGCLRFNPLDNTVNVIDKKNEEKGDFMDFMVFGLR